MVALAEFVGLTHLPSIVIGHQVRPRLNHDFTIVFDTYSFMVVVELFC